MSAATPLLQVRNVSVDYVTDYGNARAVNDVSLDIMPGETVGLAGESGCGKSTLAFAISNLHGAPALISEGEILFDNRDVLKMSPKALRKFRWNEASMVFQSAMNALNPVITIGAQITDVILAHKKVGFGEAWERGEALLETVGIHCSRMTSYPHQLSGGMRQRVVIAIALALRPRLIIMDEPTTALDVVVEREIMDELYALKKEFGFSILFISHDLSLMGEIADRIGIMYAGRLVELGTSSEILSSPVHPYTKGLVASFPTIHGPKVRLEGIPGNPPSLLDLPTGCAFAERCSQRTEICGKAVPDLVPYGSRIAACHALGPKESAA
jgi:peptide/nickel transport system ATP-binding protein